MENSFATLSQINVSDHIEKKGQFAYLSWPFAVAQLRLADPTACWEVKRFNDTPYLKTETGFFVEVAVTVQGITLSQIHPVLDGKNRPIVEPSAFDINTSIQRCLVKAIALHGLGLYIYAGEDLPEVDKPAPKMVKPTPIRSVATSKKITSTISEAQQKSIQKLIDEVGGDATKLLAYFGVEHLSQIPSGDYDRVVKSLQKGRKAA